MLPSHRVRPETGKPGACAWLSLDRLAGRLLLAGHARVGFAHRLERGAHGVHEHLEHLGRSEEHTSELQSLMRISYAVFCLKKKKPRINFLLPCISTIPNFSLHTRPMSP